MAKKNKDKKAKGKAPAKATAKPKAAPPKKPAKAPAKAAAKALPPAPKAVVVAPPARKPTLGLAAPRPGMGGARPALPPSSAPKIVPAAEPLDGEPRRSRPPPRLTVRQPVGADELKAKIGALATAIAQIRALKRSVGRTFWEVGSILGDIRDRRLFEAKGYGSFDAFVEREIELGKTVSLRLARVTQVLTKGAAQAAGMERSMAAVAALDGEADPSIPTGTSSSTSSGLARSPIPAHKL